MEDYFKVMDVAIIRAEIEEDTKATMARFMGRLNRDIAIMVKLHHYTSIQDMLHISQKVEK